MIPPQVGKERHPDFALGDKRTKRTDSFPSHYFLQTAQGNNKFALLSHSQNRL